MSYSNFNTSQLSKHQKMLLKEFEKRRTTMQQYIDENQKKATVCPGCAYPTLPKKWFHEICCICNWQHDGQNDVEANEDLGGPNEGSLTENRLNIGEFLLKIAKENKTVLQENPKIIFWEIEEHLKALSSFEIDLVNAKAKDPLWERYEQEKKMVFKYLILPNLYKDGFF